MYDDYLFPNIEDNTFAKILYEKPSVPRGSNIFKRIAYNIKEKIYYKKTFKPLYNKLKNEAPSFQTMCEISDFIRIIEKIFFYKNDVRRDWEKGELETRLLSDTDMAGKDNKKKVLMVELQKENVMIIFTMIREYNYSTEQIDEIINIKIDYSFGKKLNINFVLVNRETEFDSVHDYNLLYNINILVQDLMADIFKEYYKKI